MLRLAAPYWHWQALLTHVLPVHVFVQSYSLSTTAFKFSQCSVASQAVVRVPSGPGSPSLRVCSKSPSGCNPSLSALSTKPPLAPAGTTGSDSVSELVAGSTQASAIPGPPSLSLESTPWAHLVGSPLSLDGDRPRPSVDPEVLRAARVGSGSTSYRVPVPPGVPVCAPSVS
jgi:hypothetical protein